MYINNKNSNWSHFIEGFKSHISIKFDMYKNFENNHKQFKSKLVENLNETLVIENESINRIKSRIEQTPIQEVKQRLLQHLEETHKQKNRLEQIIVKLSSEKPNKYKPNLSSLTPSSSSIIRTNLQNSIKPLSSNEDFNQRFKSLPEETELTRIKQDYIIEYDEVVAYHKLIHIAEMTDLPQPNDIIPLLKESMQEEESMAYWFQVHVTLILEILWPKLINSPIKRSQDFLLNYAGSKIPLIIMYADLVGLTNLSMTLSVENLIALIRAFTHELSNVVERYNGYVLKYVGDSVISFFPFVVDNKYQVCKNSIECAKSIIGVINTEINIILHEKYGYPELYVKIGIDEGENVVIQYGYERNSLIDILGYNMNVAAKITSLTTANSISIGENVYRLLDHRQQLEFHELKISINNWKYINRDTKEPYKIYKIK